MKILKFITVAALAAVGFTSATLPGLGQSPVISSFGHNGQLECMDLQPGSTASVEWAASALGPWTNNWTGLESVTADSHGKIRVSVPMFYRVRGTPPPSLGRATFTKWVTAFPNQPGLIANFGGTVGGAVGNGTFGGEVLLFNPGATPTDISHFVAFYRFNGPDHSFSALVDVFQTGSGPGTKAVVTGVVADGWMKGHAVEGEFIEEVCGTPSQPCFTGSLDIKSGLTPPALANATFTKWVTTFPNQPGLIANFGGTVGGTVGNGTFGGEVLLFNPGATLADISHFVAFYRFSGPDHSFSALVDVFQTGSGPGTKAVVTGVVTDGWLKGHSVVGEFTEGICGTPAVPCFTGSLDLQSSY